MRVTQVSIGRFHHFHLARQLERFNLLESIYTGYPKFQLKDETGILAKKIKTFPWIHAPYMKRNTFFLGKSRNLDREWEWLARWSLDRYVAMNIANPTIVVALSGNGLASGSKAQSIGGKFICDRGSSHIKFQDEILKEEYALWGFKFEGIDQRVIDKEEAEYFTSDRITVPSEFVKQSFINKGVSESKINKIPYGARLERFNKIASSNPNLFQVLWVGSVSFRKGFMYALKAFQILKHPNKKFLVIGYIEEAVKQMLKKENLSYVEFRSSVPNSELPYIYSTSNVFVLPSLEEGLAMVQGEALACGCPIVATANSGCEDLITDSIQGFVVPVRSPTAIVDKFQFLIDDRVKSQEMSHAGILKVQSMGGWNAYGESFRKLIEEIS